MAIRAFRSIEQAVSQDRYLAHLVHYYHLCILQRPLDRHNVAPDSIAWAQTQVRRMLQQAQYFDIWNVAEWIADLEGDPEGFYQTLMGLGVSVPPYPVTYFEWGTDYRIAAYLVCSDPDPDTGIRVAFMSLFGLGTTGPIHFGTSGFYYDETGKAFHPRYNVGHPILEVVQSADVLELEGHDPEAAKRMERITTRCFNLVLFACSLLHCTNVTAVEVDPRQEMSRQQRRRLERKNETALVYNVVQVKPFGSYRKSVQERPGEGRIVRLHHVRGHFMEFGPEYGKGLAFGRIAGRFYCPPHVRGDLQKGVVGKTYELAKPTGKEDRSQYRR